MALRMRDDRYVVEAEDMTDFVDAAEQHAADAKAQAWTAGIGRWLRGNMPIKKDPEVVLAYIARHYLYVNGCRDIRYW